MKLVRVYVGTTEGPAEIQRITDEPPGIRSVVCLDGKAVSLPISADYDSFVRRPTGVVERLFGHSAFRMDVGARITDGLSWQLGALLAHSLHSDGRLATKGQKAETAVWATGEVDAALAVRPVDAIPRKLQTSAPLFRDLVAAQTPILVLVPREAEAAARAVLAELRLGDACRLIPLDIADQAFSVVAPAQAKSLPVPVRRQAETAEQRPRRRWLWAVAALPVLAVAAATIAIAASWREPFAAWQRLADAGEWPRLQSALAATEAMPACLTCAKAAAVFRDRLAAARPAASAVRLEATEFRRDRFGDCEEESRLKRLPVPRGEDGNLEQSSAAGLCKIRYRASGAPHIALMAFSMTGGAETARKIETGPGTAEVTETIPPWLASPIDNRLIVAASPSPLEPLLAAAQPDAAAELSADDLSRKLAAPSVLVFEVRHSIVP